MNVDLILSFVLFGLSMCKSENFYVLSRIGDFSYVDCFSFFYSVVGDEVV